MDAISEKFCDDGATTRQMKAAPPDSVFIWRSDHLDYPKSLALSLDRTDLKIVAPEWLSFREGRWRGSNPKGITLDHSVSLTEDQSQGLREIRFRIERYNSTAGVQSSFLAPLRNNKRFEDLFAFQCRAYKLPDP